jgi:hypothetical protein
MNILTNRHHHSIQQSTIAAFEMDQDTMVMTAQGIRSQGAVAAEMQS